ncbi:rRNA maturation RNase YbeY [Rubrobacter aplysinae]|uniref:rRNA maturation RNase YbeY n=1 Tax=Rubrobacter aplysinae TaxID=909625 RepID=UPI00064B9FFA|nr:rRNA maturation RNase YbeY [Rubrobacter aplysinae]
MDDAGYGLLTPERATRLCSSALQARGFDPDRSGELSVAFVGADDIHTLNIDFRDKDEPTDVLSFTVDGPGGEMVGEIVIYAGYVDCEEGAVEELVVHGALHLTGMDHGEDFEASEMSRVQEEVLRQAGRRA